MIILDVLFVGVLVVGLPTLAFLQLPLLKEHVIERSSAYAGSAAAICVMGAVAFLLGVGRWGAEDMGLIWPGLSLVAVWTGVLLTAGAAILGLFWLVGRFLAVDETPLLRQLLPKTGREKRAFAVLSLCAGVGEELAYRAYAVLAISAVVGSAWLALALACVPFGLVHVYQGPVGLVRTYILGLVLGASYLATGSLWPAMVVHTALDLLGGLVVGDRLLGPDPAGTDPAGTDPA